ncbi:MAG: hypothetical protein PGN13_07020 [Patulibacter minatonensis]
MKLPVDRLLAGAGLVGALAAWFATRPADDRVQALVVGAAALVLLVIATAAWCARHRPWAAVAGAAAGLTVGTATVVGHADDYDFVINGSAAYGMVLGGAAVLLVAPWVAGRRILPRRPDPAELSPWQLMSEERRVDEQRSRAGLLRGRQAAAAGLAIALALWPLGELVDDTGTRASESWALVDLAIVAVLGLLALPILRRELVRGRRFAREYQQGVERQRVAAHLHDSVLQTLALIQRTDDPAQVRTLARRQERELRDWLAGRDPEAASRVAAAITSIAAEVEAEYPGAELDTVTVGDAPLSDHLAPLVWAMREAMRNAARHAAVDVIDVYVEVEAERVLGYVRDRGSGFTLDEVPPVRRGVRDAILGRMRLAGGTATIDSGAHGTEVALSQTLRPPPA